MAGNDLSLTNDPAAAVIDMPDVVWHALPRLRANRMDYHAALRSGFGRPMLREQLPTGPAALTVARTLVRRLCAASSMAGLADEAELVLSELVANASLHGRPPIWLTAACRKNCLHLAVADMSPEEPRIGGRATEEADGGDGGRGLLIVDALCAAWGCTPTVDGKVVWATLRSRTPAR
jgi:anti-sigma regulatory factor (Ser/Thr protein kinase)